MADLLPVCTLVGTKKNKSASPERFSLLLLEFGEIYFEDFSAVYFSQDGSPDHSAVVVDRKQRGRMKICSHSVLFDPLNFSNPVIKIAFRDCVKISLMPSVEPDSSSKSLVLEATQMTELLEGNVIAPYKFTKGTSQHIFSLNYGSIESVLAQLLTLHRATKLPRYDHQSLISSLVMGRRAAVSFNTSWLEDLYEERILENSGERITPLVSNPGRIMLTSSRLYFQPYNNIEVEPVLKIVLKNLKSVHKRRYMLKHVGLELLYDNDSMFLVLASSKERNELYEAVVSIQPTAEQQDGHLLELTHQWQTGTISNYDYLMKLNFLADRSFNDIMQYPVMPWIIADYRSSQLDLTASSTFRDLSRPIGALNKERLEFFKKRYSEMSGGKFLYGTHYSAPGYVLYFLVRRAPEYLLCLQNGNFDRPNRLFHSIAKTWENVNTDHADVKELIPEFYQPPGNFLVNSKKLDLGLRSDGERVNDVVLPPWAKDAADFTKQCRDALESEYVSNHLHHWIDLIFGYKQQGQLAEEADNVFHFLTYEGAFDLDHITNHEERAATELQIREFGQTPRRLFALPHPRRLTCHEGGVAEEEVRTVGATTEGLSRMDSYSSTGQNSLQSPVRDGEECVHANVERQCGHNSLVGQSHSGCSITLRNKLQVHKEVVSCARLASDQAMLFSVSHDKTLKVHLLDDWQLIRSSTISNLPLSCLCILPDSKTVLVGSWDNNIYTYSVEFASVTNSTYSHDSSVTCLAWRGNILVSGSWDSTVKVWGLEFPASGGQLGDPQLLSELDHDSEVCSVGLNQLATEVISGTVDGFVTVWKIKEEERDFEFQGTQHCVRLPPPTPPPPLCLAHSGSVKAVSFSQGTCIVVKGCRV